jgi:hypothetical protein
MNPNWGTFESMNKKGIITRDARLSIRVPRALKETIERYAAKDRQTVADTVILMLEEATQRRARRTNKPPMVKSR